VESQVFDRGKVRPALLCVDVGDIRNLLLVGPGRGEIAVQKIGCAMVESTFFQFFVHSGLSGARTDAQLVHQTQNCLVIDENTLLLNQMDRDTAIAIGLSGVFPGFLHQLHPGCITVFVLEMLDACIIGGS
jgi:hypothetical protein